MLSPSGPLIFHSRLVTSGWIALVKSVSWMLPKSSKITSGPLLGEGVGGLRDEPTGRIVRWVPVMERRPEDTRVVDFDAIHEDPN
jgi:hypothetical protein